MKADTSVPVNSRCDTEVGDVRGVTSFYQSCRRTPIGGDVLRWFFSVAGVEWTKECGAFDEFGSKGWKV